MKQLFLPLVLIAALIGSLELSAQTNGKPHPQASLDTTVAYASQLLKEEHYRLFFDSLMSPEMIREAKEKGYYERMASRFGASQVNVANITKAFAEMQSLQPKYNDEMTEAVFVTETEGSVLKNRPMKFKKLDGRWYINSK